MSTVIIAEYEVAGAAGEYLLNLSQRPVTGCSGCFRCWWNTPGRCVHKDLDDFYRAYVNADTAIFYTTVSQGFVSGNLKSLFDRLLPLFLPYSNFHTGESMHNKRYPRYPDIQILYSGEFSGEAERKCYESYLQRVFYQFHSPGCTVEAMA